MKQASITDTKVHIMFKLIDRSIPKFNNTTTNLVETTSIPKSASGRDETVKPRPNPESSPPYEYICSLLLEDKNGSQYPGAGFKIHVPGINRCIVVTAARNVYINGAYCKKITVTFPGQAAVTVDQEADMYASQEYRESGDTNHDYGMVLLPGNSDEGFGWSAILQEIDLINQTAKITKVYSYKVDYLIDAMSGKPGSPVYMWYEGQSPFYMGHWCVFGIHSNGGYGPNRATRLTSHMIYNFLKHAQNLKKYSLRSVEFRDVYVRCDGNGINSHQGLSGGGTINCQFEPPSDWETFYMFPVAVTPSSLRRYQTYIVALQNVAWPNTYVHMDGRILTEHAPNGGGAVNCQWSGLPASDWESFILKEDDMIAHCYRFLSFANRNRYIRLDGRGVTEPTNTGGGVVNCQFYEEDADVSAWEKFILREEQ